MSNDYLKSFYELGYTHSELEALLNKVSKGELLTKEQYDLLMASINMIEGLTSFNGTYDSLPDKPDIPAIVKANGFTTAVDLDAKGKSIQVSLQASLEAKLRQWIADVKQDISNNKADVNHVHDDRYSFANHNHDDMYINQNVADQLVTRDLLAEALDNLDLNIEIKPGTVVGGTGAYMGEEEPENKDVIWFTDSNAAASEIAYDNPIIAELFACIQTMQKQISDLQAEVEYLKIHGGGGLPDIPDAPDLPDDPGSDSDSTSIYLSLEDGGLFELEEGGYIILEQKAVVIKESVLELEDGGDFLLEDGGYILLEKTEEIAVTNDSLILLETGSELLLENNKNILLEN